MAIVTTNDQHYHDIADAIREKNGSDTQYTPAEMPAAIQAISGGGEPEPPDDGKTRLYIHVPENAMEGLPPPRADVPLYIAQTVSNGVSIDWGDDSEPETIGGMGNVHTTHHYAAGGDYIIALTVADGCELGLGSGSKSYCVMGSTDDNGLVYCGMLKKVIVGANSATILSYAFGYCYGLEKIIISSGVTNINGQAFYNCFSLSSVAVDSASSIRIIRISSFFNCSSLSSFVIPSSVEEIASFVFHNCYGVKEFHILTTTPPNIQSNTFDGISSDCIIYVPAGTVDAFKTATNWAALADHIQEEPT